MSKIPVLLINVEFETEILNPEKYKQLLKYLPWFSMNMESRMVTLLLLQNKIKFEILEKYNTYLKEIGNAYKDWRFLLQVMYYYN